MAWKIVNEMAARQNQADAEPLAAMFDMGRLMQKYRIEYEEKHKEKFQSIEKLGFQVAQDLAEFVHRKRSGAYYYNCLTLVRRFSAAEERLMLANLIKPRQATNLMRSGRRHEVLTRLKAGELHADLIGQRKDEAEKKKKPSSVVQVNVHDLRSVERLLYSLQRYHGNPCICSMLNDNTHKLNRGTRTQAQFFDMITSLSLRKHVS